MDSGFGALSRHRPRNTGVRLVDRIVARRQGLADHPQFGPARPEIAPEVRVLVIGDPLALYRIEGFSAVVVRVVHGARRLRDLFGLGPDE